MIRRMGTMAKTVKVYNKGTTPIVWSRNKKTGPLVIHPGKYDLFGEEKAKQLMEKFKNAVSESEFRKEKSSADKKKAGKESEE